MIKRNEQTIVGDYPTAENYIDDTQARSDRMYSSSKVESELANYATKNATFFSVNPSNVAVNSTTPTLIKDVTIPTKGLWLISLSYYVVNEATSSGYNTFAVYSNESMTADLGQPCVLIEPANKVSGTSYYNKVSFMYYFNNDNTKVYIGCKSSVAHSFTCALRSTFAKLGE